MSRSFGVRLDCGLNEAESDVIFCFIGKSLSLCDNIGVLCFWLFALHEGGGQDYICQLPILVVASRHRFLCDVLQSLVFHFSRGLPTPLKYQIPYRTPCSGGYLKTS